MGALDGRNGIVYEVKLMGTGALHILLSDMILDFNLIIPKNPDYSTKDCSKLQTSMLCSTTGQQFTCAQVVQKHFTLPTYGLAQNSKLRDFIPHRPLYLTSLHMHHIPSAQRTTIS